MIVRAPSSEGSGLSVRLRKLNLRLENSRHRPDHLTILSFGIRATGPRLQVVSVHHRERWWRGGPEIVKTAVNARCGTEPNRRLDGLTGRLTEVALGYQSVLAEDPRNPEALVGMSLVALASQQTDAAVKMASAAIAVASEMCAAWVALGQALRAAGRSAEAEEAYEQAIRLDRMDPLARLGLGELRIASGHAEEATREFELALLRQPSLVAAHFGLGNALALAGRNEEALLRYYQALALRPRLPEAEYAAGFALARLGRLEEAETRYRRALTMRPDFAAVWVSLGCLLREQGREVWAAVALKRAVRVEARPDCGMDQPGASGAGTGTAV
jgi:tetratricopeptide (TPR) repeat protein